MLHGKEPFLSLFLDVLFRLVLMGSEEIPDVEKYAKIVQELAKLKKNNAILKKAVLDVSFNLLRPSLFPPLLI